jgi:DNA mismatch repair protein MLH1
LLNAKISSSSKLKEKGRGRARDDDMDVDEDGQEQEEPEQPESWSAEAYFTNANYQAKKFVFLLFINRKRYFVGTSLGT